MSQRKYSEKFIDEKIKQIDDLYQKCQEDFPILPEYDLENKPWLKDTIKRLIKHRSNLSYIDGFWLGYSLALGLPEEKQEIK